jgi:hypothetical protein
MREPSTLEQRWAWWESAVAGDNPPVHEMDPQAGFYAVRKFRYGDWAKGPFLPARIWWESETDPETGELVSPEECRAEIDGVFVNPWRTWTWLARRPIPESEWKWLRAQSPLLPTKIPRRPSR